MVGPPGAGKTTFCQQSILQNLALDRPIIYVSTEYSSFDAEKTLKEKGLGEVEPSLLYFVDAYDETVGVSVSERPDTVYADCSDLSSIDIAISKLSEQIDKKGILLVFDSLTTPYLLSGSEILCRFVRPDLSYSLETMSLGKVQSKMPYIEYSTHRKTHPLSHPISNVGISSITFLFLLIYQKLCRLYISPVYCLTRKCIRKGEKTGFQPLFSIKRSH